MSERDYTKGLTDRQLGLFDTLIAHSVSQSMARALSLKGNEIDVEQAIDHHRRHGMTVQGMLMFMHRKKSLDTAESKAFYLLERFCGSDRERKGDELLAMQIVEDYDTAMIVDLAKELEPTGADIIEFANKVLDLVRPKIVDVEADPELAYDSNNPPF